MDGLFKRDRDLGRDKTATYHQHRPVEMYANFAPINMVSIMLLQVATNNRLSSILLVLLLSSSKLLLVYQTIALAPSQAMAYNPNVVRLCIASSDPIKLSSQCVLCDRREFPLTVVDCTGYTRMNELTSSLLSVVQATCLIYNCRKQLPSARPQPFYPNVNRQPGSTAMNALASDSNHYQSRYPLSSRSAALHYLSAPAPPPPPSSLGSFVMGSPYIPSYIGHRQHQYNPIYY